AEGNHSIVAQDTDSAGNTGTSAPVLFSIDLVPPTVTINTPGGTTNAATQTISGKVTTTEAAQGTTVLLYDNGGTPHIGTATVQQDATWTRRSTLPGDGNHSIVAKDTDAAGNTGTSDPVVFTLDTEAPTVTISTAGGTTNVATHTISGSVSIGEAAV